MDLNEQLTLELRTKTDSLLSAETNGLFMSLKIKRKC